MHNVDEKPAHLDYRLLGPCVGMVASCYGLARYTYGLFLPTFRDALQLADATLSFIAAVSYAGYVLAVLLGIYLLQRISARAAVVVGGLFASVGMACIAAATDARTLALGVVVAGVSPGLAWTPISEIVGRHVQAPLQRRIYAVINAGTSVGVLLGGPAALLFGMQWRQAWACFAAFALLATLWCARVIPAGEKRPLAQRAQGPAPWASLFTRPGLRVLALALGIGMATSVYWTFAVDLVASAAGASVWFGLDQRQTSQWFWCLVGVAGLAGMGAGAIVDRLGPEGALKAVLLAMALAMVGLAASQSLWAALLSGALFGASFMVMSAALGIWSMEVFAGQVSTGFGLTYLMLSLGQFAGPLLVGLVIGQTTLQRVFLAAGLLAAAIGLSLKRRGGLRAA